MSFECKVVSIYDGDTITIAFVFKNSLLDSNHDIFKMNCRLYGIDCPELRSRNEEEKRQAIAAKDFLREQIENKIVRVQCYGNDKYGRLLVEIFVRGAFLETNVNRLMVQSRHAVEYDGGKKSEYDSENFSG